MIASVVVRPPRRNTVWADFFKAGSTRAVIYPDLGMDIVYHEWDKPPKPRCGGIDRKGTPSSHRSIPDLDRSRSIKRRSIHEMSSALVAGTSCALLEKRT